MKLQENGLTPIENIAGLNMKVCLTMGIAQLLLWTVWAGVTHHPSRWKLWVVVVGGALAMFLEIYDFPPYWGFVDAHAVWHALAIPFTYLWWSFVKDDSEFRTSALMKKVKQHRLTRILYDLLTSLLICKKTFSFSSCACFACYDGPFLLLSVGESQDSCLLALVCFPTECAKFSSVMECTFQTTPFCVIFHSVYKRNCNHQVE